MAGQSPFDAVYGASPAPYYGAAPSAHLKSALESYVSGRGRALDVGCGDGRNALYLAALGYAVTAFDPSASGIAKLTAISQEKGLTVAAAVADMTTYDYGHATYDLLVASNVLVHAAPSEAPGLVRRWIEGLAPGGHVYVSVFTTEDPAASGRSASETTPFVDTFYDPADFRGFFEGLSLLRFGVEDFLDESHGPAHYHQTARYFGRKPLD